MRALRLPVAATVLAALAATFLPGMSSPAIAADSKPKHKDTTAKFQPKEATFTAKVEPATARPGDTVTYTVTMTLDDPWHTYAYVAEQPSDGPRGTQFDLFETSGLTPDGEWKPTKAAKTKLDPAWDNTKVSYHEGAVSWTRKLKVPSDARSGKQTIKNQIYFQICDPKQCKQPAWVTLPEATLTITPSSTLVPDSSPFAAASLLGISTPAITEKASPKTKDTPAKLQPKEATFTTKIEPATAKPGDTVTYKVTATVDESWHIYAYAKEQPSKGPRATGFDLFETSGLIADGEWKALEEPDTKLETAFDNTKVSYHEGEVSWVHKFKVPTDAVPGKLTIKNQIYFQLCDPNQCKQPTRITLPVASVSVTPGSTFLPVPRPAIAALLVATMADVTPSAAPKSDLGTAIDGGIFSFLLYSALGGLFAVMMPCVWPMIPITVNFFVKQGETKPGSTTRLAVAYCLAIVGIFTGIGLAVTAALGATGANQLGVNKWVNLGFGVAFIALGLSLLGLFEIRLPTFLLNASAQREGKGGILGVMFMATTLTITSFTCTAPVVGTLLVASTRGQYFYPVLGLLTFSTVLALPFFLLALMPGLMKTMPRSGDWMNAVKVVGGLVEIALAFKFLNTAEIGFAGTSEVWIDARFVLTAWVVTALACGIYLLGLFRTDHDYEAIRVGPLRMVFGIGFLIVSLFLAPALFGNPPKGKFYGSIVGILPPDAHELDSRETTVREVVAALGNSTAGPGSSRVASSEPTGPVKAVAKDPKVAVLQEKKFHGVVWGMSYDEAIKEAKEKNKLVLIDFTGLYCANCRKVEQYVMPRADTVEELKKFVTVSLYTDRLDIPILSVADQEAGGEANLEFEVGLTEQTTSPLYAVVTPEGKLLGQTGYQTDQNFLRDFLRSIRQKHAGADKVAAAGGM